MDVASLAIVVIVLVLATTMLRALSVVERLARIIEMTYCKDRRKRR